MSLCPKCGVGLTGDASICSQHVWEYGDDWAVANRLLCDFFHRAKPLPRLPIKDRDEDFWAHASESA